MYHDPDPGGCKTFLIPRLGPHLPILWFSCTLITLLRVSTFRLVVMTLEMQMLHMFE